MSALATAPADPDAVDVFHALCEARALLVAASELSLQEAVDGCQQRAEAYGLVISIGQDAVQAIIAAAFAAVRDDQMPDPLPPPEETEPRNQRAAASTIEALMFSLRERGAAALAERDCQRRLAELSSAQLRDVIGRLMELRERYPAITDELLFLLGEQLS